MAYRFSQGDTVSGIKIEYQEVRRDDNDIYVEAKELGRVNGIIEFYSLEYFEIEKIKAIISNSQMPLYMISHLKGNKGSYILREGVQKCRVLLTEKYKPRS